MTAAVTVKVASAAASAAVAERVAAEVRVAAVEAALGDRAGLTTYPTLRKDAKWPIQVLHTSMGSLVFSTCPGTGRLTRWRLRSTRHRQRLQCTGRMTLYVLLIVNIPSLWIASRRAC